MKITPEVAQALVNLRGNRDFSTVLKWIEDSAAKATDDCTKHDGLLLYRAQGAVGAFKKLTDTFTDAPVLLKKFQSQSNRPV